MLINKHQCADYIQGYVFSTPVSTESILEMVDGLAKKQSAKQSVRSGKNVA
jgi:EAL domain-containing protein (putative c-di-GMP-specific phosphodiesterase class I)